jgi:predicted dehydrogenase
LSAGGAPAAYGSYDELVHDNPQVDIVYVASRRS